MARGRAWTIEEDDAIREAARLNRRPGGYTKDLDPAIDDLPVLKQPVYRREYARRLAAVAEKIGRSREAVYKRAQRLGERSKEPAYFGRRRASPKPKPDSEPERGGPSEPWDVAAWLARGR